VKRALLIGVPALVLAGLAVHFVSIRDRTPLLTRAVFEEAFVRWQKNRVLDPNQA